MKKLMIAAAIVCAAAMSQAASISWQSEFNFVDEKGNVQLPATAPAGDFVLVYLGTGTADWDHASVVNTGTIDYDYDKDGNPYAMAYGNYTWTADSEGKGEVANGDIFGVMFKDGDGKLVKLSTVGGEAIDPTFTVSGLGSNTYSGSHDFASSDYTVASVPEPTSAMLLLLGVAGLALKRRRA